MMPVLLNSFDSHLATLFLARKHVTHDCNSILKSVSEVVFGSQLFFEDVRHDLLAFIPSSSASSLLSLTSFPDLCLWISLCYERRVILWQDVHGQDKAFGLGFKKDIVLLYSFVNNESHFDLIVKEKEMRTQALVQCQLFCLFLQIICLVTSLSL